MKTKLSDAGERLHPTLSGRRRLHQSIPSRCRLALSGLLCDESQGRSRAEGKEKRTVGLALVPLVANLAHQLSNTLLAVNTNDNRFVVVAEQTNECCVCRGVSHDQQLYTHHSPSGTLVRLGPGFLEDFLRLPIVAIRQDATGSEPKGGTQDMAVT